MRLWRASPNKQVVSIWYLVFSCWSRLCRKDFNHPAGTIRLRSLQADPGDRYLSCLFFDFAQICEGSFKLIREVLELQHSLYAGNQLPFVDGLA